MPLGVSSKLRVASTRLVERMTKATISGLFSKICTSMRTPLTMGVALVGAALVGAGLAGGDLPAGGLVGVGLVGVDLVAAVLLPVGVLLMEAAAD